MSDKETFATATSLKARGRAEEAARLYLRLVAQTHAPEAEYDEWMAGLAESHRALGRLREAGHVLVYLRRFAEAHASFVAASAQAEAARASDLHARTARGAQAHALHARAAEEYAAAALSVHAAISYGLAGRPHDARREWEAVARDPRLAGRPYEQALAAANLGLVLHREGDAGAPRLLARAQRILAEAADDFEARGERERAFDCYAILLELGREERSFENLAEGYTSCIRICQADQLKFYALSYYEDFLRLAIERDELHAAAQIAREAADYARRLGLVYDRGYQKRSAETWWLAAEKNERDGGPVELTENAYLAAISAFASLGDFFHVRETYERLARAALPDAKRERYERAALRYAGAPSEPIEAPALPEYLRQQHAYPPIWEWDLVEWELDGDAAAVCASLVGDRHHASTIRRRALQILLLSLEAARGGPSPTAGSVAADDPARLSAIAQGLGELSAYVALRPLEKLLAHPHESVRRGVMRACKNLYFKRTFQLLARGLADESHEVREAAIEALQSLHFPHAFDPLARILREQPDPRVKTAALTSIGRIATLQAGELLIDVLRHEAEPLREVARRMLASFDNPEIFPLVKRYAELSTGAARADLQRVLRGASHPDG